MSTILEEVIGTPDPDAYRALLDRIEQWLMEKDLASRVAASPDESLPVPYIQSSTDV
jgi:hypothetical protein